MKTAALFDIHGNLLALRAVLADVSRHGVERVLVGGDVVDGPLPGETLELLHQLEPPPTFVRGNTERAVVVAGSKAVQGVPGELEDRRPTALQAWVASRLSAGQLSYLAGLPRCWSTQIGGRRVLFCHATPRSDRETFTPHSSPSRLEGIFAGVVADVVVCGHYDLDQAVTTIKASGYPAATDFIRQHLQHPPPMAESVAYFERRAAADPSGGVEPAGWPP